MDALLLSLAELAAQPRPRALVGGKAASLAKLMAAGIPVPEGVVLTTRVAELPAHQQEEILAALSTRAQALGAPLLAVRSSATIEDDVASAAPGIFVSRLNVAPHARNNGRNDLHEPDELINAVHAVWASAQAPLVRAYAKMRNLDQVRMAVIIQAQVPGLVAGVAYTRPPGHPDAPEMLIETHATPTSPAHALRVPRGQVPPASAAPLPLDASALAELVRAVARAEHALGASAGADVEWVASPTEVWIVQARPIVHPPAAPAPAFPEALIQFSCERPDRVWRWDLTHNPDPLSPAQIGLVERVDRAGLGPYRMRVVGGYLYTAQRSEPGGNAPAPGQTPAARDHGSETSAETLRHELETTWLPALERALAAAEAPPQTRDPASGLVQTLAAYERFYDVYAGALSSCVSRARQALPTFLRAHLAGAGPDTPGAPDIPDAWDIEALTGDLLDDRSPARLETLVARVAHGRAPFDALLAAAGPMSPAWDVAAPTFAETPGILHQAVALVAKRDPQGAPRALAAEHRVRARLAPHAHDEFARCLALARTARDIGELDDRLYARAQAAVRHALLRLARTWRLHDPEDIFFLPLDMVVASAGHATPPDPVALRRMARAGRAARERQRAWTMPLAFANGQPMEPALPAVRTASLTTSVATSRINAPDRNTWHGRGTGGRARGTAVRIADLAELSGSMAGSMAGSMPATSPDAILVVSTITPAMALVLPRAVAVVAQHGGLLGHGAAMARELGLPCVVDCARVWQDLRTGDPIWVDGEAGLVVRTWSGP